MQASAPTERCGCCQAGPARARTFLYTPGSCTLVGLSAMFMSVALTIWLFTVYCVPLPMRPAPASRSLMNSEHLPRARRCHMPGSDCMASTTCSFGRHGAL